jgi:hypothetical protein
MAEAAQPLLTFGDPGKDCIGSHIQVPALSSSQFVVVGSGGCLLFDKYCDTNFKRAAEAPRHADSLTGG